MTEGNFLDEQKLVDDAKALKNVMEALSSKFVEAAKIARRIEKAASPHIAEALLTVQAGVTHEDIRLLRAVGMLAENDPGIPINILSPESLRVLSATSKNVRAEAIRAFKAGYPVGEAKLQNLERHQRWTEQGADITALLERAAGLESLALQNMRMMFCNLQAQANVLRDTIVHFVNMFAPHDPEETEMDAHRAGYEAAHADIIKSATDVLQLFEMVFGKHEDPCTDLETKGSWPEALKLNWLALRRFSSGRFGHNGGFAFDIPAGDVFSKEIVIALDYICVQSAPEREYSDLLTRPPRHLHVLELGAGAGGQALGLMSAGFKHVGLYEKIGKRAKTLKANWPTWPVIQKDLRKVQDSELTRHRGIDLLAGGISSNMVARQSKKTKRGSGDDLVPELLRAVRLVKPRAFMFESVRGFLFASHVTYLAEFKAGLKELGYDIESFILNMKHFGLPRDEERLIIVGIRLGEHGTFLPPVLRVPIDKFVQDALGELVVLHETPDNLRNSIPMKSAQRHYDRWAALWRSKTREKRLSTIPREWKELRQERQQDHAVVVSDIKKLTTGVSKELSHRENDGFDHSSFTRSAPSVVDFEKENDEYRPRLTEQMVSKAQGFPDKWTFKGKGGGNIDMIADALPPALAKAIGLQIYSALTGVTFDLDAALARPIVNDKQIGVGDIRLNGQSKNSGIWIQLEKLLRAEQDISQEPTLKKRQAKLRSILSEIEPNHMRRKRLVGLMERIQCDRERQAKEDDAWREHYFPNGIPEGRIDD